MTESMKHGGIPTYMGNRNLKKAGVALEWTHEQIQEYAKCKEDPIYFVETYMKIINVDRGLIPLKLYPYQKKLLKAFLSKNRVLARMSRQCGKSTTYCAFVLHYIIFNDYKKIAILANKGETAIDLLGRIQMAYENLPKWLQHGVVEYNKKSFVLENDSSVIAAATSSDSIRGQAVNVVILDEVAFIDRWDEFYASTYPVITSGKDTKLIFVSTPRGLNHFYKFWKEGTEKELDDNGKPTGNTRNGFTVIDMKWDDVPGRDAAFRKKIIAETSLEQWNVEYCCEFLGSSGTLISGSKLKQLSSMMPKDTVAEFKIRVYEEPIPGHRYITSVDVSRGVGLDASAISVIDITTKPFKQVCVMNNSNLFPHELERVITSLGKKYNNSYLLIENNDLGQGVAYNIFTLHEYEYVLFSKPMGQAGLQVTFDSRDTTPGLKTTKKTKQIGCQTLKNLIESNQLSIVDEPTINELYNFIKVKDTYKADDGYMDDLAMSLVIFAYLADTELFKELQGTNFKLTTEHTQEQFDLPSIITPDDYILSSHFIKVGGDVWFTESDSPDNMFNFNW